MVNYNPLTKKELEKAYKKAINDCEQWEKEDKKRRKIISKRLDLLDELKIMTEGDLECVYLAKRYLFNSHLDSDRKFTYKRYERNYLEFQETYNRFLKHYKELSLEIIGYEDFKESFLEFKPFIEEMEEFLDQNPLNEYHIEKKKFKERKRKIKRWKIAIATIGGIIIAASMYVFAIAGSFETITEDNIKTLSMITIMVGSFITACSLLSLAD